MSCILYLLIFMSGVLAVFVEYSVAAGPELIGIIRADSAHVLYGEFLTPLGDQDGDGDSELLVSSGRYSNYLYRGGQQFDTVPWLVFDSTNSLHTFLGDINHDGFPDFAIPGRSEYGFKMGLYLGGPTLDNARDFWFGRDDLFSSFLGVSFDADIDGQLEYVSTNRFGAFVYRTSPWDSLPWLTLPDLTNFNGNFAYDMAAGDFNGDGHDDLAIGLGMKSDTTLNGRVYIYFADSSFDSLPDLVIIRPDTFVYGYEHFGNLVECPGDMNNDGADELFVGCGCGSTDLQSFLYLGGSSFDSIPDLTFGREISRAAAAGDLNSDGYADLIASNPLPWSGAGTVYVWYGGPVIDTIPDERLDNWQYPGYHVEFGRDVVGLGDFNGDGIDDFAFSMYDIDTRGLIYIYSGRLSTGIDIDPAYTVPTDFTLSLPYPNPFNGTTRLNLNLPRRGHLQVSIHNLLGQRIDVIADKEVSAGIFALQWHGVTATGEALPSGVYLIRVSFENAQKTRKIMILK